MKFNFLVGTVAIVGSLSACGGQHVGELGMGHANAGKGNGDGHTGGSTGNDQDDAGAATGDRDGGVGGTKSDGRSGTGGSNGNGRGDAGRSHGNGGSTSDGSTSDGRGDAGATTDTDDDAGGPNDDGGSGRANGGTGGVAGNGGVGGLSTNAGKAGVSGSGGSGGVSTSTGAGGVAGSGGAGGVSTSAGAGGGAGSGGAGGLSTSAGAAGVSNSGGSGDVSASGGAAGLSNSGGSGDVSASAGAGGLPNSAGTGGGVSGHGGSGGSAGGSGDHSLDPHYLFTTETFGGNGRTCVSCHTAETGTIGPDQVQALYSANPGDPLFRPIDSDDGLSDDYSALREHATFRVTITLPAGVHLASDPAATSVVFRRSVPTTINTPALDPTIMWDGRAQSLTDQALGAILGHAEATVTPTETQLELIAQFEQGPDFFSSDLLRQYSDGGPAPTWPPGVSDAEQRGRRWFAQDSAAPRFNICGQCHGGPMANETQSNSGLPVGQHFQTVNVSEFNHLGNPTYDFTFPDPNHPGQTVTVTTPDPGRALVTGDVRDVNFFKIPTLWGVKNTAPYFHDNSAATLEELMDHYEQHLGTFLPKNATYPRPHVPTAQDKADIVAYLKLL